MNYNPKEQERIRGAVQELCDLMVQQESLKEAKKDIIAAVKEDVKISTTEMNTFAKIKYEDNLEKAREEAEEIFDTYEMIFKPSE